MAEIGSETEMYRKIKRLIVFFLLIINLVFNNLKLLKISFLSGNIIYNRNPQEIILKTWVAWCTFQK